MDESETKGLTGMRKWIANYHAKRPGLSVVKEQINAFIAEYEAREEKATQERLAAAQEDGWTVVVGNKGRKKTTDVDSGIKVSSVATAVAEKVVTKKSKKQALPVDFYRFQRREARRNEVLELQKKFDEDKKRIAKLRAARKFRPF